MRRFSLLMILVIAIILSSGTGLIGASTWNHTGGVIEETTVREGQRLIRWDTEPVQNKNEPIPGPVVRHHPLTTFEFDDPTGTLLWQHSDPAGIGNDVAVADYNDYLGIGYYLNNERMSFFQRASGTPIWEYTVSSGGTYLDISGDGQVVMFSNASAAHRLDPTTGSALWDFPMPTGFTSSYVDVSRDGSLVVLLGWGPTSGNINRVWAFDPVSSTPLWSYDIDASEAYGWYGATISNDNSRVAVNGKFHMYVLDIATGNLLWDADTYNTESPARLSEDGYILTSANLSGNLRVFYWDTVQSTYQLLWEYSFSGGSSNWASTSGVSADGSTVATGSLQFLGGSYAGYAAVFETFGSGIPLWTSDSFGDMVGDCALSDDGLTVAFVSWGDLNNTIPDLQVFEKYTDQPFYTTNSPGSLNDVDISVDGTTLIAGGKAVHNRQMGNGGNVYTVELSLGGGTVTGTATLTGQSNHSGVRVYAVGQNRETTTDSTGSYTLEHVPAGTHEIRAEKQGYSYGSQAGVVVTEGGTTPNIDFTLISVGNPPTGLSASQGLMDRIVLTWDLYPLSDNDRRAEVAFITGDDPTILKGLQETWEATNPPLPKIMETDEADSIRIYRSAVTGGPYTLIATTVGDTTSYTDTYLLFPTYDYYYVVTAVFSNGESDFSNEAMGNLDDSYLIWDLTVPEATVTPTFDGVISAGEWDDAIQFDISDVFGYDTPDPPGSAYMYLKYDEDEDLLYVAAEDLLNTNLDDNEGIGFYVDDNDNSAWDYSNPGSEGNFWAYYYASGSTLRYRSLSGGEWASNYYVFSNPELGFSDAAGHLQCEVALPLGFRDLFEIGLHGPDRSPGIGAFIIERVSGNAVFHGWWPQNMASIVSYPSQFGDCTIDCELLVPPAALENVTVEQSNLDLLVNWDDPTIGIDSLPLTNLEGIHIYRNGDIYDSAAVGSETYLDQGCEYGGWYGYGISGWVEDGEGPLEGVISSPVGAYAGETPNISNIIYDDGTAEAWYVVSFSFDGNLFGIRFSPQSYPTSIYTLDIITNDTEEFDFLIYDDNNGLPDRQLTDSMAFASPSTQEFNTFHLPGITQPLITAGDFWVIIAFREDHPGDPGVGVDYSTGNTGRCYYYTHTNDWTEFTQGMIMVRAGVGDPLSGVPDTRLSALPASFTLNPAYPNPFNPTTVIPYAIPTSSLVNLTVYNLLGQRVATLVDNTKDAGYYNISWNADQVASGIYIVRMQAGSFQASRKIVLLK